jgi:hypothetical protein
VEVNTAPPQAGLPKTLESGLIEILWVIRGQSQSRAIIEISRFSEALLKISDFSCFLVENSI